MIREIALGPVVFHTYGFILGLAIAVGWWWAAKQAKSAGIPPAFFERAAVSGVVGGVVGARLYHVIDLWNYYQLHLPQVVAVWSGGLGIWGAVLGGLVGVLAATRHNTWYRMIILDAAAMALPLSQAIGRWGNWVNYELFGRPTTLPWGLYVPPEYRPESFQTSTHFHPLFLYESLANLLLFGLLNLMKGRGVKLGTGNFMGAYLMGYSVIRYGLEPLRMSVWQVGELPMAQILAIGAFLLGSIVFLRNKKVVVK